MAISFNDRNKIDYGINYKIFERRLCFYGNVQKDFEDKTIVLQIMNTRHKILKEIWIHGKTSNDMRESILKNEEEYQSQGYEIF